MSARTRSGLLVLALTTLSVGIATGQARKAPPAAPPAPLDTALTVLPAGFTGSTYDAVARHLQTPERTPGFYAIRLARDGLCEDHQVKAEWRAEKGQLAVLLDGAHSSATPGVELLCDRKIVGDLSVTAPSGEKFRAARIVERGNFVVPMETELRWQSHFEMYAAMPEAEAQALLQRLSYFMVVEPALERSPAAVVADSTREPATLDVRDDVTRVQTQIYARSLWLYAVDPTTRKVVVKGPLLPGSCP